MALTHFISLREAAQKMRMSTAQIRELVESGKIEGGILPDGEMVVTEESLPLRKEDLPEYKKYSHLKGVGISASDAERKYRVHNANFIRWAKAGFISTIGWDRNRRLLDEQDVAYCVHVYRQRKGQGKWLFNPDGTPYIPKSLME
jgi:predicted site-specific integrase-resolvase